MTNKNNNPAAGNGKSPDTATPCTLMLQPVAIDTYHENVAYLHRNCEVYRAEGFQALSRILTPIQLQQHRAAQGRGDGK